MESGRRRGGGPAVVSLRLVPLPCRAGQPPSDGADQSK